MATAPQTPDDGTGPELPDDEPAGEVADLEPPNLKDARLGIVGKFYRYWRYRRKLRKKAANGYVQWYLIEDGYPQPKFVKPEMEGAGIPELEYGDGRYLFPHDARLPDKQNGMWVVAHNAGDATPINLTDPDEFAVDPGVLQRYAQLKPETEPPSWWDDIDIDPQDAFLYLIIGIVAYAFLSGVI